MSKFNINRIKLNSSKIWVEISEGSDANPFDEPISMVPTEKQLNEIQQWCVENQCGTRMSYDQFVFKNKKELSMFMLKWS